MAPSLDCVDHIHVYVTNRANAEQWYASVLGLSRVPGLAFWAADGGPLTLSDASGKVHLALFERRAQPCRSTVALGVSGSEFMAWQTHLSTAMARPTKIEDHQVSWSLYFSDPDGNPYEITTYEYGIVAEQLAAKGA